jgi:hypothetical protein
VPAVPVLLDPPANVPINLDANDRVTLTWRPVTGAVAYDLQVSQSRVFAPSSIAVRSNNRPEASATIQVLQPGTYYWRVAAAGTDRLRSEWSGPRAFKAYTGKRVEELVDTTPPKLEIAKPTQIGNMFLVQGRTEPGCTVTVNGELVDVGADGAFKKAIAFHETGAGVIVIQATDPAGNKSEHREHVFLEAD